jgi:hypothetical protein
MVCKNNIDSSVCKYKLIHTIRLYPILFLLIILFQVNLFTEENSKMNNDPLFEARTDFINMLSLIKEEEYYQTKDFLEIPGNVYFEVARWTDELIKKNLRPEDKNNTLYKYYFSSKERNDYDLLYRTYTLKGMRVKIKDCTYYVALLLSNYGNIIPQKSDYLHTAGLLCQYLPNVEYPINFEYIKNPSKFKEFSSNQNLTYTQIRNWKDRIDGFLLGEEIGMIIFKKHIAIRRPGEAKKWFPEDFRKEHRKK